MVQSKKSSLAEAITNTAIGFVISLISIFFILPLVGVESTPGKNIQITLYFTVISILRGYVLRRYFNKRTNKSKKVRGIFMYCFECETEMPAQIINKTYYCSNCGLRH